MNCGYEVHTVVITGWATIINCGLFSRKLVYKDVIFLPCKFRSTTMKMKILQASEMGLAVLTSQRVLEVLMFS